LWNWVFREQEKSGREDKKEIVRRYEKRIWVWLGKSRKEKKKNFKLNGVLEMLVGTCSRTDTEFNEGIFGTRSPGGVSLPVEKKN